MTETVHFLGGSPLNRLSWLRPSSKFLNMVGQAPQTRWAVFQAGQPLVRPSKSNGANEFALLSTAHVKLFLEEEQLFGQGEKVGEAASLDVPVLEACRLRGATVVFLGLEEPDDVQALPSLKFRTPETPDDILGTPYFCIDLAHVPKQKTERLLTSIAQEGETIRFDEPRSSAASFSMFEAAIFAVSRSMLDWNIRNKYCAACGSPTYSLWGGWKLSCSSLLPWQDNKEKARCPSGDRLQNYAHPRTDPVVIVAVIDETDNRVLLGRNKKFPSYMYSTLAGFCEPAESFEDAAKREIWEESGVRVHNVQYHSSQPWPYPANLMVGCYATADSSQPIRTDLDNELADARWFTREEVLAVLRHAQGTIIRRTDNRIDDNVVQGQTSMQAAAMSSPPFRVPPRTAIAGVLISDWATGKYSTKLTHKGNL